MRKKLINIMTAALVGLLCTFCILPVETKACTKAEAASILPAMFNAKNILISSYTGEAMLVGVIDINQVTGFTVGGAVAYDRPDVNSRVLARAEQNVILSGLNEAPLMPGWYAMEIQSGWAFFRAEQISPVYLPNGYEANRAAANLKGIAASCAANRDAGVAYEVADIPYIQAIANGANPISEMYVGCPMKNTAIYEPGDKPVYTTNPTYGHEFFIEDINVALDPGYLAKRTINKPKAHGTYEEALRERMRKANISAELSNNGANNDTYSAHGTYYDLSAAELGQKMDVYLANKEDHMQVWYQSSSAAADDGKNKSDAMLSSFNWAAYESKYNCSIHRYSKKMLFNGYPFGVLAFDVTYR